MTSETNVSRIMLDLLLTHRRRIESLQTDYVATTARTALLESWLSSGSCTAQSMVPTTTPVKAINDVDDVVSYTPTQVKDECEAFFGKSGALSASSSKAKSAMMGAFEKERHPRAMKSTESSSSTTRTKRARTTADEERQPPSRIGPHCTPQEYWDITFSPRTEGK